MVDYVKVLIEAYAKALDEDSPIDGDDLKKIKACLSWISGHYPDQKKVYFPKALDHILFEKRNGFNALKFILLLKAKL